MRTFQDTFLATVRAHRMFSDCRAAVLAVSGGPDSLALLHLMAQMNARRFPALTLHAAHLHHGIRGADADADARFVEGECARLGIACTIERRDVPRLARRQGVGEEVAGRAARYDFLTHVAARLRATHIVTGHHAGDQAETVLMRAMRGAGPRGMGAIPYVRGTPPDPIIVRPLLDCTRDQIQAFLNSRSLAPRFDHTNLSPRYLRNRIRRQILPALATHWGAGCSDNLCRLARAAQGLSAHGSRLTRRLVRGRDILVQPRYLETSAAWLRRTPAGLLPELVRHLMTAAGLWRKMLDRSHYERIRDLLQHDTGVLTLPGETLACRSGNAFILCAQSQDDTAGFRAPLALPGITPVPPLGAVMHADILEENRQRLAPCIVPNDPLQELVDYDALKPPLVLRFPRPGDRMRPLGAPGTRTLRHILADCRVPRWRRHRTLLLTADNDPVWLVGCRIAHAARLTPATRRALRLRLVVST